MAKGAPAVAFNLFNEVRVPPLWLEFKDRWRQERRCHSVSTWLDALMPRDLSRMKRYTKKLSIL